MILLINNGCGVAGVIADAGDRLIAKQAIRIDEKLRSEYGILPEDDLKTAAKKMFTIESEKDPNLAGTLLKVGPEAWDEIKDLATGNKSLSEKIAAGVALAGQLKGSLDGARDENGNIKLLSGGIGIPLFLIILRTILMYRKEKKKKESLMDVVEVVGVNGGKEAKKKFTDAMKKVISTEVLSEINADVAKRFPEKAKITA